MDEIAKMQYIDMIHRLPEDVLQKADRMGMAHSLEVRLPYLDPEVWKIAARLPMRARIRGKQTKYVFRRVAGAYLNRITGIDTEAPIPAGRDSSGRYLWKMTIHVTTARSIV